MWQEFLSRVLGEKKGFAFITYRHGTEWGQEAYRYPLQLDEMVTRAEELNKWADVYFCPHLFSRTDRHKEYAKPYLKALWIDKDKGSVADLEPRPTICWQSSEGKHQAVWILNSYEDSIEAEQINKYLTYKCGGDKGGWHLNKLIRLPDTINYKYTPPQEGFIRWDDGPTYDLDELRPKDDELKVVERSVRISRNIPKNLPTYSEVLQQYGKILPTPVWNLLNAEPTDADDWSDNLWRLERLLIEAKLPIEAVFVLAENSPWNKYKRMNRPPEQLWQEIVKAFKEKPDQVQTYGNGLNWLGIGTLLDHSEIPEWLVEDIWMDKNVGWIAGVGKSYKSTLTLDLALSIASGKPFLDKFKINKPGPVLMVQEEDPVWRVARRCQLMCEQKGITSIKMSRDNSGLVLQAPPRLSVPLHVSVGGGFLFKDDSKLMELEDSIDKFRPRMVIIDPWFMTTAGIDEFKSSEIVEVLNILKKWRNNYDCSIGVVHHYNKSTGGEGRERLYGSMALYAWSENSLFVARRRGENVIVIDRDIKDSDELNKLVIDFHSFCEEEGYNFDIMDGPVEVDKAAEEKTTKHKVESFLRSCKMTDGVDSDMLGQAVRVSRKTINRVTKALLKEDKIVEKYVNRKKLFFPTEKLYEGPFEGGMIL